VARRGADRPPYVAAVRLAGWAAAHHQYLAGRLTLAGVDPATLDADRYLNVVYAIIVDSITGLVDRGEVFAVLNDELGRWPTLVTAGPTIDGVVWDPETWGTTPDAQANLAAALAFAGPPAGEALN
jgi:hypothetical protein